MVPDKYIIEILQKVFPISVSSCFHSVGTLTGVGSRFLCINFCKISPMKYIITIHMIHALVVVILHISS